MVTLINFNEEVNPKIISLGIKKSKNSKSSNPDGNRKL